MKRTGSRRSLVLTARALQMQLDNTECLLAAAALASGGVLAVTADHLQAVGPNTDLALRRRPDGGIDVVARHPQPAPSDELTVQVID